MGTPYIGEIRMFGGSFAPAGWAFCDGQLLPISENDALFTLIGTEYGGDGEETFALPNLQSRVPLHFGAGPGLSTYAFGETGGVESVTLTPNQIPTHNHALFASTAPGENINPTGGVVSASPSVQMYIVDSPVSNMAPTAVVPVGGSQPHENRMPILVISYIISLFGVFPTQT